jgi:hypothetical protein
MEVDHLVEDDEWLTVVGPVGRMQFMDEPVSDSFFERPYKIACAMSEGIRRSTK